MIGNFVRLQMLRYPIKNLNLTEKQNLQAKRIVSLNSLDDTVVCIALYTNIDPDKYPSQ